MNRSIAIPILVLAAGIASASGVASAETRGGRNDAVDQMPAAKMSLAQAAGAAESHSGGRATKAELEHERGVAFYRVEVVSADRKVYDVEIDAGDGKVLSTRQDRNDRGDREDDD
jgi:uncharacterized membrane protein YkoI